MGFPFMFYLIGFSTNADISNQLVFGKDMNTWLIYVLVFLTVSGLAFSWVWIMGFLSSRAEGNSVRQPWD